MSVPYSKPIIFIASWNKEIGIKIENNFPISINLDLEQIAMQIFITYQNFFSIEDKNEIKRSFFEIPIKNLIRKAKILIDSIVDERNNEKIPYIVVILFPDYIMDKVMDKFNDIMEQIGTEFLNKNLMLFSDKYAKITELLLLEQKVQDKEIIINENYSSNDSVQDFKKGIELFSKKSFEQAYFLIKKAFLKFKSENNVKLLLDSLFFIATTLSELNKFQAAQEYYEELASLASSLNHQKYLETALFMVGFCAYKRGEYEVTLQKFSLLNSLDKNYINKFQYYSLWGRILRLTGQYDKSLQNLESALDISEKLELTQKEKENKAQIILEMGHIHYKMAIDGLKANFIIKDQFNPYFQNAIKYYDDAIRIWEDLENFTRLKNVYQLVGNIYEVLNETDRAISSYDKALKYAEMTNDALGRMEIYSLMVYQYQKNEEYEILIKFLDEILSKLRAYAFIDLNTISNYHMQLGKSLIKIGKKKEALSELLIALNIYNQFKYPIKEGLDTLQEIINIYKQDNQENYVKYYEKQYNDLLEKIQNYKAQQAISLKFRILNIIKELWIFTNEGVELLSSAPESKLNPQLFGGFISALQALSTELSSEKLRSVMIGSFKYSIYTEKDSPIFIIGRSTLQANTSIIEKILRTIFQEFLKKFHPFLEDYDGDSSRFLVFLNTIEKMTEKDLIS
ncbi:MAG: hypothetical protein ACFFBP_17800 [Promethearchaeota archaeon]